MKRHTFEILATLFMLHLSGTVALPAQPGKSSTTTTTTTTTNSNNSNKQSTTTTTTNNNKESTTRKTLAPQDQRDDDDEDSDGAAVTVFSGVETASKAKISAVSPRSDSYLAISSNEGVTLSFDVQASGIRKVRIFVESNQIEPAKYVIRGDSDAYALTLTGVPPGDYEWRIEILTDSNNDDIKKQKFGPWEFTVAVEDSSTRSPTPPADTTTTTEASPPQPPSSDVPITAGLQQDCLTVDPTKFNICLDLKSPSGGYEPWMEDFGAAKKRWESILRDDGEDAINLKPYWKQDRDLIATSLPPLVDDIYISGFLEPNDGPGGILGMAGPYFMKTDSKGFNRPISGYMVFDVEDEPWLRREGIWTNTIIHEMGHVLGLGTMWEQNNLHSGSLNDDKYRTSSNAQAAWEEFCPGGRLPVETADAAQGIGAGTAGGHWDEECMVNELMTGFINTYMPLSKLTVASLADMGYVVDYSGAEPFGRSDLGNCAKYCPEGGRNLRAVAGGGGQSSNRFQRPITPRGHIKILKAAAKEMAKIRSITPPSLPTGLRYYAGEYMTVYIRDEDDQVKEETVSWSQAKQYAPDAINY